MPDARVRPDPPAKSRGEAIDRYRHRMQTSLGLVCQGQWFAGPTSNQPNEPELVLSTNPWPVRIVNVHGESIFLFATQRFRVDRHTEGTYAGQYKVQTTQYIYALADTADVNDAWIHWHWHPPKRDHPHLHVRVDLPEMVVQEGVRGRHVPTGRVSLEALIRYLIDDCDVEPREGGREVLEDNETLFRQFRSWS